MNRKMEGHLNTSTFDTFSSQRDAPEEMEFAVAMLPDVLGNQSAITEVVPSERHSASQMVVSLDTDLR